MKILLLSKYTKLGASSRLRTQQFIPYLEKNGCDVTINSFFDDIYLKNLYSNKKTSRIHLLKLFIKRILAVLFVKKYDLIWIEKEILPYFPSIFEFFLNKFNVKYIVDYDDAIFHNYDKSKNKLIKILLSKKIANVMKYSSMVVVGNDYLSLYAKRSGAKNITYIPTVVDINRYLKKTNYLSDVINIGWIGTPYTQKYIIELKDVLEKLQNEFFIKILAVGANENLKEQLAGLNVEIVPWSENSEANSISRFDIGIMPLHDGFFEKGKCGYKLIQYMATGIPVIGSPIGVNTKIITDANCGLLALSKEEWYANLKQLIIHNKYREEFGINGRIAVENKFSLQFQRNKILEKFKEINHE